MNFQDDFPSIPFVDFRNKFVLVFDLASMQVAAENCPCSKLTGESLRPQLNFTSSLDHITELIVLVEIMPSIANDKFDVAGKKF